MAKVSLWEDTPQDLSYYWYCPGCRCGHGIILRRSDGDPNLWTWNGDVDKPTVHPSIDYFRTDPTKRCHTIITDGMIHYLPDCHHHLKGQTVPMEEDD